MANEDFFAAFFSAYDGQGAEKVGQRDYHGRTAVWKGLKRIVQWLTEDERNYVVLRLSVPVVEPEPEPPRPKAPWEED